MKDWKEGCHKVWCGKSGEKCIDYEIRDAGEGKGVGLFALRDFKRSERILVERAVATLPAGGVMGHQIDYSKLHESTTLMNAAMALAPATTSTLSLLFPSVVPFLCEKFEANHVTMSSIDDDADHGSGIFLNFSRINHDCIGNSSHYYDPTLKLIILAANHDIPSGSEVTFSYFRTSSLSTQERKSRIGARGFRCTCLACRDPVIGAELLRKFQLDQRIVKLGSMGKVEEAIRDGELLIKIYDELQASDRAYSRTYYDLYQVAIMKKSYVKLGLKYIRQAYTHELRFCGREVDGSVKKFKHFVDNPDAHPNYRWLD